MNHSSNRFGVVSLALFALERIGGIPYDAGIFLFFFLESICHVP
jgi:hypothetical protein